jgi:hypothetical protein
MNAEYRPRVFSEIRDVFFKVGNNRRALVIHLAASIVGGLSAGTITAFILGTLMGRDAWGSDLGFAFIAVTAPLYVVLGALFFSPTSKPLKSIAGFTKILLIVSAVWAIAFLMGFLDGLAVPDGSGATSIFHLVGLPFMVATFPFGIFFNAIGLSIVFVPQELISWAANAGYIEWGDFSTLTTLTTIALCIAAAYTPALLMSAGMKLRCLLLSKEKSSK